MGLASSQARMLLLTARKSDLEYRAQMISQRKMNLALETERLATDYSRTRSNRIMQFVYQTDMSSGTQFKETLSYDSFLSENSDIIGNYLLKNSSGKYLVTGKDEAAQNQAKIKIAERLATNEGTLENYQTVKKDADGNITSVSTDYKKLYAAYASQMSIDKSGTFSNPSTFQEGLRNGSLILVKLDNVNGTKNTVSWSSMSFIRDNYNTEDDAEAEANYEAQSMLLSNQDKALDLELRQIETQHKAVETEVDSVKKVIEKNVESTFKTFE